MLMRPSAYAVLSGEDPANVRAQISGVMAMAPIAASGGGVDVAVITDLATAISSFVQDARALTISLAPPEPATAQTFMEAASNPPDLALTLDKAQRGFRAGNK